MFLIIAPGFVNRKIMRLKLKLYHKLFIAFTVTAILMVTTFSIVMHWMAYKNFSEYVTQAELQRSSKIKSALINYYEETGSWDTLKNRRSWFDFLRENTDSKREEFRAPSNERDRDEGLRKQRNPGMGMRRGMDHRRMMLYASRVRLHDASDAFINGNRANTGSFIFEELKLNDTTIGKIGLLKPPELSNPIQMVFLERQKRVMLLAGGILIIIGSFVAWMISRGLLKQIHPLQSGTQKIASRKFDTRISVHTSDELGELANSFNQMATTLEGYEKQQRQWISDISHELGTPLSVLKGEIEAMQDGIRPVNLDQISSLQDEVIHMEKIVKDLKFLSSAETGELRFEWENIDPVKLLKNTLLQYQNKMISKDLLPENQLDFANAGLIKGDSIRLKQVYLNLFENCLRYSQSPGSVYLTNRLIKGQIIIEIEDEGPGVPEESLNKLFDRLYRVDYARSREAGGSGLGLAISKQIIEQHQGKISASQGTRGGLKITITLPVMDIN